MHATNSWLQPGKVNQALGPDCDDSPHSIRAPPLDLGIAPYLALTTALLPNGTTESFQMEAGPPYDKQRIQMGLRKGNTVLIYFRSGVVHYQCVLIALASDLSTNKPRQGQHKFWRYVSPIRTSFAWLPKQLALTYCRAALEMRPRLPYGDVHHLQGQESDFQHSMVFQNIYHIGDTKSAQELEVFLRMPRERLRLCCGIQCTDSLHPNGPRQRRKLFTAALKLLWFAIGIETVCCENEEQRALKIALLPLLRLEDGHVLATLSAIVLALCEGRTGLAISGVFGAGKTRSAAALLAGLLVFDPSLQLMVPTKESVAAHAVAEHLVSLKLPDRSQGKMGRLVGYYEQNRKGSYTPLDIPPSNRNQVLRQKSLLIGCGSTLAPLLTGWVVLTYFLRMKGNNMGTWKRRPQLPEHRLLVWRCGLVTTGKRLVVWKRAKSRKHFGRNSPSAPLLWDAKLSILKLMIWGVLPCDIWTALRVHSLGKYDNSWKTTPLPSTLQLCRFGMTPCLEKSIVPLSPSCGWA